MRDPMQVLRAEEAHPPRPYDEVLLDGGDLADGPVPPVDFTVMVGSRHMTLRQMRLDAVRVLYGHPEPVERGLARCLVAVIDELTRRETDVPA